MGYFALPSKTRPDVPDLMRTTMANLKLFEEGGIGYSYSYLIQFGINYTNNAIQLAEDEGQEIGIKPFNPNPYCNIPERIKFIRDCFEIFKENNQKGLAILHTIKGELELISLQLKEL